MSHQGRQEDEGIQIKDETKVVPDVDHDVNRAEIVEEHLVKPETEMLPVFTEGQIAFGFYSVLIYGYRNTGLITAILSEKLVKMLN